VADTTVTLDTIHVVRSFVISNLANKLPVTAKAIFLDNCATAWLHLNWLVEILKCEVVRVPETVLSFRAILADKIMGDVTRIAGGKRLMAGFGPAIKLLTHNVTVHAGRRVV
jgi:hypothetical protein